MVKGKVRARVRAVVTARVTARGRVWVLDVRLVLPDRLRLFVFLTAPPASTPLATTSAPAEVPSAPMNWMRGVCAVSWAWSCTHAWGQCGSEVLG